MIVKNIHTILAEHWGYTAFRPMQEAVIKAVLDKKDAIALLATGGGKTICYQVPTMAQEGMCLVVSPLIALMEDQLKALKDKGIRAAMVNSSMHHSSVDVVLENACQGALKFLFVSPERIQTEMFSMRLEKMPISLIAIDEAHCISQWGHDFRPAYRNIAKLREVHPQVPVLALSATATPEVVQDIQEQLAIVNGEVFNGAFTRPELVFWKTETEDKLGKALSIAERSSGSGIFYCRRRRDTERLAEQLKARGIRAAAYHAGLESAERSKVQERWTKSELQFVCATNAFGMGIDKGDVRVVVHMAAPDNLESYYQEAGRAGRDGETAHAILLCEKGEAAAIETRVSSAYPSIAQIRQVYQSFVDCNQIAIGSEEEVAYPLDAELIKKRSGLHFNVISNSFKALELDGRLLLSDGGKTPSRIQFLASSQEVMAIRQGTEFSKEIIEAILRNYGGMFEEATIVEEELIARQLQISADTVRTELQRFDQMGVLTYKERSSVPLVSLLEPRQDSSLITLEPASLQLRKERNMKRARAMMKFVDGLRTCRSAYLQSYFTHTRQVPCGVCDLCKNKETPSHEELKKRIEADLESGPIATEEYLKTGIKNERELSMMRYMIDAGELHVDEQDRLSLNA